MDRTNDVEEEDAGDPEANPNQVLLWYPRSIIRRTNHLHRMDALCRGDVALLHNMTNYLAESMYKFGILMTFRQNLIRQRSQIENTQSPLYMIVQDAIRELHRHARVTLQLSICVFQGYLSLAYYPSTNRIGLTTLSYYGPERYLTIDSLGMRAYFLTGFTIEHLTLLSRHLRIPQTFRRNRRLFTGEMAFIRYLCWMRKGMSKVDLALAYFGGDPRKFTEYFDSINDHLYDNFYHKISGDSLRMWKPQINSFRRAIWESLRVTPSPSEIRNDPQLGVNPSNYILQVPFESFRIFGFIDDLGQETTAPGRDARRHYGYTDDIQRAMYSGYFANHGLKAQLVMLPNGMIGSIYIVSQRNSDGGTLNMSGLDEYLPNLLQDMPIRIEHNGETILVLPALYGDAAFPHLTTIVARYRNPTTEQDYINRRLSSRRMAIEHMFGIIRSVFRLFHNPLHFQLLRRGDQARKTLFNSFLLYNCRQCLRPSSFEFNLFPPTLQDYLPLEEVLEPAPVVTDADLGVVYNY